MITLSFMSTLKHI